MNNSPEKYTETTLLAYLEKRNIGFTHYAHPAVFTVAESQIHTGHIPGTHCKNLFLQCQKSGALFLVTAPDERVINLKALAYKLGVKKLSFGKPELLMEILGVTPGSVTPLALINDVERKVTAVLDAWMMAQPLVNFHPLVNTATVTMTPDDLSAFMKGLGYQPCLMTLEDLSLPAATE